MNKNLILILFACIITTEVCGMQFFFSIYNQYRESQFLKNVDSVNVDAIRESVKSGININCQTKEGFTALRLAVNKQNVQLVKLLLEQPNIDVDLADILCMSPLIKAVSLNNKEIVKLLLSKNANVNLKNYKGTSAIHVASIDQNYEIIKLLLEVADIEVNAVDVDGYPPTFRALFNNNLELLKLFINSNKTDINAKNSKDNTILYEAVARDKYKIAKYLLQLSKTDVNYQNKQGDTALILAIIEHKMDMIKLLLTRKDININAINKEKHSALMIAVARVNGLSRNRHKAAQLRLVKLLLAHDNTDINAKTLLPPFFIAVENELPDIVKLFVDHPYIDLNIKNNVNASALKLANSYIGFKSIFDSKPDNMYKIIKLLIAAGAEPIKDWREGNFGVRDSISQVWKVNPKLQETVKEGKEKYNQIFNAVAQNDTKELMEIAKEYTLNVKDSYGHTPLHLAVSLNNLLMVKIILELNPTLICVRNKNNQNAVDIAVADRHGLLEYFVKTAFVK